ncbi:MAG: aminotransferase class V-fold PLP-dependent enzyme [Actinobacteria bacterium]|nr:aminotransferase class V-fold PLP-dependent enzyme [Actinomycetota bacterium]MCG2817815.1 aminotransferase class V-fold PLP-dependent enzyme [Actinomycetes bacterium]MBU4217454.1 aminotransferase class V-fold PLP-dependent enzyme [Actinomycetota bacterium]MBU4359404.1 aminotransferase class V-fold PLP-dependent enzyme [Actinomycetota bacterium]MBU4392622.1 aminotransferase class V-fold PLP-dependent enzyme [Actinomycetota bacterium]
MACSEVTDGRVIYLDNAATSWPKPGEVCTGMVGFQTGIGANPGRSGHRLSVEAGRVLYQARERVATLFNVDDPLRVIFTLNATDALNIAMRGLLRPGDHVITSSLEHNSVMRPLRRLEKKGVGVTVVPHGGEGLLDPGDIRNAITGETKMIVVNHASNVTGTLAPLAEIGTVAREHGLLLLVDAAQTGGSFPIDIIADSIDLLAFTGHKSMMGPQGTGGLAIGNGVDLDTFVPLKTGGTGSRSESEEHPDFLPDKYESGTPNTIGIAGLGEGVRFVLEEGVEKIRAHEMSLAAKLVEGLGTTPGVTLYGPGDIDRRVATVSFNIDGIMPSEVGYMLDEHYGIMCRVGLHCAPAAHRAIGTFPEGTVRLSIGYFNTADDIEQAIEAVNDIAKEA